MVRLFTFAQLLAFLLLALAVRAQHVHSPACGTDPHHEYLLENVPGYAEERAELETFVKTYLQQTASAVESGKTTLGENNSTYVIPVVVHVIWGDPTLSPLNKDSISYEQVLSNFPVLFNDFRCVPGTRGYSDNCFDSKLEFQLATKDPNGNPHPGVNWHYDPGRSNHTQAEALDLKTTYTWDKTKYFNVWLVGSISGTGPSGGTILGYATFPSMSTSNVDGIVIRTDCWGTLGTAGGPGGDNSFGRTATHEVGHWINLFHTFQSSCGSTNCASTGDQCCDTPPTSEANYGNPNQRQNTCTSDFTEDRLDNPRNYMDYVPDIATNHFTKNQVTRAHAVMNNPSLTIRYNLWQPSNLQAAGVGPYKKPVAGFVSIPHYTTGLTNPDRRLRGITCEGGSLTFKSYSQGQPDSFVWSFPGGTPSTSTDPNPTVVYNTAGSYDVTLTVFNQAGSDTLTLTEYVIVKGNVGTLPFSEDFNVFDTSVPSDWDLVNPDFAHTSWMRFWDRVAAGTLPGGDVNRALRINLGAYSSVGETDGLVLPSLDLSTTDSLSLKFRLSYVPLFFNTDPQLPLGSGGCCKPHTPVYVYDSLSLHYSTDCGYTWTQLWKKGGPELSYGPNFRIDSDPLIVPENSEWKSFAFNLDSLVGHPNVRFMFRSHNRWGNSMFLDDVVIDDSSTPLVTSARQDLVNGSLMLFPNPARSRTEVQFELAKAQPVTLTLLNSAGAQVARYSFEGIGGVQRVSLPLTNLALGLYLVQLNTQGQVLTEKLLVD